MSPSIPDLHLSVNVDHVATLRQARQAPYPDPVEAARLAEEAGARGITVHLRGDRRHIQDEDVRRLSENVQGKLNVEMATTEEMLDLARELRPQQVTLVPERPEEVTTEGGLDLLTHGDAVAAAAETLKQVGIEVSVFLDPDLKQVDALARWSQDRVRGFEINTDAYTKAAWPDPSSAAAQRELDKVRSAALRGAELGLRVYAGHGLTTHNVSAIAALAPVEELNIGHWLVSRAAMVGMAASVSEMLSAMTAGRKALA